jgi:predicted RNase H-like HicB family nuclease
MKKYAYPAVFTPDGSGFKVIFPDLESCYTQGDDLTDALEMAGDVLNIVLYRMEKDGKQIPEPSAIKDVRISGNSFASLVVADTLHYGKLYDNKTIKKTLSIPAWMNTAAEEKKLNFSKVLQEGLQRKLGVE